MSLRGFRGAVTAPRNSRDGILGASRTLVRELLAANGLAARDVVLALFTMTPDLDAAFPAEAARGLGGDWVHVPMLCTTEAKVRGALKRAVRVLLLAESRRPRRRIRHLYLGEATCLRPDLAATPRRRRRPAKR